MKKLTKLSMIKPIGTTLFAVLMTTSALASDAYGDPFKYSGFVKEDWQVVCDNTLTCRAAGYESENQYDMPASILITAKPMQSEISAKLNFYSESEDGLNLDAPTLWLNGKDYGDIGSEFTLNTQQINALLELARQNVTIEIKAGNHIWKISDKGMASVLLKLDDVQGRVGTPLALVSKDNPKRQTPKKARPKPTIQLAFFYPRVEKRQLAPSKESYYSDNIYNWVNHEFTEEDLDNCYLINTENEAHPEHSFYSEESKWVFTPVDATHTLASHLCWQGAYNEGHGYWVIEHANPTKPKLITLSGYYDGEGEISANHKGRGIGDCWSVRRWLWDGDTFVRSFEMTTGLCRGFAGGAWDLPTYVSEVIE